MNRRDRPLPFPRGSAAYRQEMKRLKATGWHWRAARMVIRCANNEARLTPLDGELCGARRKRDGLPCQSKALQNGRCRYHGGLSTGAKTQEGKARSLLNLKQFRTKK